MGSSRTRSDRSSDVLAKLGAGSERHGHELFERLTQGIRALADSEQWRRHLDLQSRFHHYSANNVVLIGLQRPDATRVAGFSAWRRLGRSVRKGEKALWIMAPIIRRKVGSDSTSSEDERVVGFKYVPVFDIAQTQGPPLPDVCSNLPGDDPSGVFDSLKGCAVSLGFHVIDHDFGGSANGDCNHLGHEIRVEVANGPVQRIKTLAHELAHAVLHKTFNSRVMAELEAESTAYI
ncbi:MAG: ArdC-like ssDNA-binding domain-containing protein, partial [Acidimicrobiales bacterium]